MNLQYLHNLVFGENSRQYNSLAHLNSLHIGADTRTVTQSFTEPDQSRVWGFDVSGKWDGKVNMQMAKDYGASFVFIKVIDGTIPTAYWRENIEAAIDAGLIWGPYGWLYPDKCVSCTAQAKAYYELIKDYPVQIPAMIDFEWTRWMGQTANPNYQDLQKWVSWYREYSGINPGFYSAAGYMNNFGTMPRSLRDMFEYFCVANYGVTRPLMPMGFRPEEWDFWQFSCTGDAQKIARGNLGKLELDLQYFNGNKEELGLFLGLDSTPDDGEQEGTTMQGTVKPSYSLRVRDAGGADTGIRLAAGDVVYGPVANGRISFQRIYRLGRTVEQVAGNAATVDPSNGVAWMILADVPEPTPEPQPDFPPRIGYTLDGVTIKWYVPE